MRLQDIIGQPGVSRLLLRLTAAGRLPHALLLEGRPGCGRRTLARALAQALLCTAPVAGDACGTCRSCQLVVAGTHPDLTETRHDAQGGEIGTEEVREEIVARAYESPLVGERRVFVLYGVERLHAAAANALLKVLEEPPAGTYLVATCTAAAAVLATIRSRTQLHRLQPLAAEDIARILRQGGVPDGVAEERAGRGQGSHRGLWGELEALPLAELRSLCLEGWSSAEVARAVAALPDAVTAEQEEAGVTVAQEQRRAVRHWLSALAHDLRTRLRAAPSPVLAARIERLLTLERDLDRNLPPRLVIEAVAIDPPRSR